MIMRWVVVGLAIVTAICIAVWLFTGFGWEIGGPISAALAGICWWLGLPKKGQR